MYGSITFRTPLLAGDSITTIRAAKPNGLTCGTGQTDLIWASKIKTRDERMMNAALMKIASCLQAHTAEGRRERTLEIFKMICWRSGSVYHSKEKVAKWNPDTMTIQWLGIDKIKKEYFTVSPEELSESLKEVL